MNRSSTHGRTVLIVLSALLLLMGVLGIWMLLTRSSSQPSVEEGRAVADAFLESIHRGSPEHAWQSASSEFKSAEGREVFVKRLRMLPELKEPMTFVSMQTVEVGGEARGEFLYRSEEGRIVRLLVNKEYNEWKVDRMTTP